VVINQITRAGSAGIHYYDILNFNNAASFIKIHVLEIMSPVAETSSLKLLPFS